MSEAYPSDLFSALPVETVQYRDCPGFPGYRVGDDGSVWSCWKLRGRNEKGGTESFLSNSWKKLNPGPIESGHLTTNLRRAGKTHHFLVHRLVLIAFVGPCPEGMECRHFPDRNPANNRLGNLSWGTRSENVMDRVVHGTHNRGSQHPLSKLTEDDVIVIRSHLSKGVIQRKIATMFGVDKKTINDINTGKTWSHFT